MVEERPQTRRVMRSHVKIKRSCYVVAVLALAGSVTTPNKSHCGTDGFRIHMSASYSSLTASPGFVVNKSFPPAVEFNSLITGIDQTIGLGGGVGWRFRFGLGVFCATGYSYGSATDVSIATNAIGQELGTFETEYRISTIPISVGADYHLERGHVATTFDGAFQVNYLEFTESISELPDIPESKSRLGKNTALGAGFGVALEWIPLPQLSAGARVGFITVESVRLWKYDVDLTGPSFTAYVEYRPCGGRELE